MSITAIKTRKSQLEIIQKISKNLKGKFRESSRLGYNLFFDGYKRSGEFDNYRLVIWDKGDWLGLNVRGPSLHGTGKIMNLLGFTIYSPKSGTRLPAARFAQDEQGIALYHDGRVFTRDGRPRPRLMEPMHEIDGHEYFRIAYIEDEDFFDKIMAYNNSRDNPFQGKSAVAGGTGRMNPGVDLGSEKGGRRSEAVYSAKHHPIAKALHQTLLQKGLSEKSCQTARPDLLMTKGSKTFLFEVKPLAKDHDLILACGQVLIYNEFAKADCLVIVSTEIGSSGLSIGIRNFARKHSIQFVAFKKRGKKYEFEGLEQLLPAISE